MGLFKKNQMIYATLTLNARLQPEQRYEYYEKMLNKALKKAKLGVVDGGGTMFTEEEGPLECDINIDCYADKKEALLEFLRPVPAPKGSKLIFDDGDEVHEIGDLEGMAVYLNGTELGDEVYAECDVNYVISEMCKRMADELAFLSFWTGNKETALYFYGKSFERMKAATADFTESYPLCRKCRIEQIA